MKTFQPSHDLREYLEGSFLNWLDRRPRSILWIGNTEDSPISTIKTYETKATLILKIKISDIHLVKLDLQITPETLLIKGQQTAASVVEGYFRPSGFESLIPLPHPVEPETCWVQIQPDGVEIQLAKKLKNQPPQHWIELSTENAIDSSENVRSH
ncbi:MAG: Hsp20/alpha crystallin family protein [Oscillatoriaceae cyanobacterium Prado104]|jgi:HSP20 family molecular chaperone IbpA|nr:Hsp20/alpha crystallin family protein [Oscillatoriaceae cyanobacterium Prado104]